MRQVFGKRWVTVFAIVLWASAALLQGFAPIVSPFIHAHKSEVEAAAIHLSGHGSPTCVHHPEGCPADCLCPKTGFVNAGAATEQDKADAGGARLHETTWATCSASRGASAPAFAVYLPPLRAEALLFDLSEALVIPATGSAREVFRAVPAKIPIV